MCLRFLSPFLYLRETVAGHSEWFTEGAAGEVQGHVWIPPQQTDTEAVPGKGAASCQEGPRASAGGGPGLCTVQDTAQGYLGPSLTPSESIPTPK